jgi:selenide,water dikinase
VLRPLHGLFPTEDYPDLLVGLAEPDDAAVYRLASDRAVVSTVDFFPPVVDDPYSFGAIAAANALSDIYAMGGEPLFAINLVAYPDGYSLDILTEILRGGAEKVREAGAVIAGGHTVTDTEPKYGLAVTGVVHPDRIMHKGGAQPGDILILTKPLGVGVVTTAHKRGLATEEEIGAAVASMSRLNRSSAHLARQHGVRAMTDVTGYSLLGHAHEMAHLGHVGFDLDFAALEWLPGALRYGEDDVFPGGQQRNRDFYAPWVTFDDRLRAFERDLLFDPQTSGGLLMAVPHASAAALLADLRTAGEPAVQIGEVTSGNGTIRVRAGAEQKRLDRLASR